VPSWVVPVAPRPRRLQQPVMTRQDDAGAEVRQFFVWLRARFWGDASRTTGFEEDGGPPEVRS
jgi:hypothetical protein